SGGRHLRAELTPHFTLHAADLGCRQRRRPSPPRRARLPRRSTGGRHLRIEPDCSGDRAPPATPAMASEKLHAAATRSGDLPLDALRDILLRLSAKELCRLRAVSPTWRSLTYDRSFIAAHMARHREPLLAFARRGEDNTHSVDIV
ncbi:unnamed protein product, partial [Urochloa humidicola]